MDGRAAFSLPTLLCGALLLLSGATSFYLPGLAPVSFCAPDKDGQETKQVPDCKVKHVKRPAARLP